MDVDHIEAVYLIGFIIIFLLFMVLRREMMEANRLSKEQINLMKDQNNHLEQMERSIINIEIHTVKRII